MDYLWKLSHVLWKLASVQYYSTMSKDWKSDTLFIELQNEQMYLWDSTLLLAEETKRCSNFVSCGIFHLKRL